MYVTQGNQTVLCPSCDSAGIETFYRVNNVPVHSVLNMKTREKALSYPKRDIHLGFCPHCGFIFNTLFEDGLHEYSPDCEETQGYSPTFNSFSGRLAEELIQRYGLRDKTIIEIGCGKGEFLTQLCEIGGNRGIGIDPAYAPERNHSPDKERLNFIQDFYSEKYADLDGDFLCCKMTLEHIRPVAGFLSTVRRSLANRKNVTVFFQIPEVRRILRENGFWDIYYEHCSYFSLGSLGRAFRKQGFEVRELWTDYGDQYLMVEARAAMGDPGGRLPLEDDLEDLRREVEAFQSGVRKEMALWRENVSGLHSQGGKIILWGSGSKAVSFLSTLGIEREIEYVVDINPYRQGTFMAGTGQRVIAPDFLREYKPDQVIVMNPIYESEIGKIISEMGFDTQIRTLGGNFN